MTDLGKELFNMAVAMNKVMQLQYQAQHDADQRWLDELKQDREWDTEKENE